MRLIFSILFMLSLGMLMYSKVQADPLPPSSVYTQSESEQLFMLAFMPWPTVTFNSPFNNHCANGTPYFSPVAPDALCGGSPTTTITPTPPVVAVPEPDTLALLAIGLVAMLAMGRKRKQ